MGNSFELDYLTFFLIFSISDLIYVALSQGVEPFTFSGSGSVRV